MTPKICNPLAPPWSLFRGIRTYPSAPPSPPNPPLAKGSRETSQSKAARSSKNVTSIEPAKGSMTASTDDVARSSKNVSLGDPAKESTKETAGSVKETRDPARDPTKVPADGVAGTSKKKSAYGSPSAVTKTPDSKVGGAPNTTGKANQSPVMENIAKPLQPQTQISLTQKESSSIESVGCFTRMRNIFKTRKHLAQGNIMTRNRTKLMELATHKFTNDSLYAEQLSRQHSGINFIEVEFTDDEDDDSEYIPSDDSESISY